MATIEIVLGIVLMVISVALVLFVLFQSGKDKNLSGAISGAADTFMEKGKARTLDAFLAKWTKVISIVFFVLVFAGMLITQFVAK